MDILTKTAPITLSFITQTSIQIRFPYGTTPRQTVVRFIDHLINADVLKRSTIYWNPTYPFLDSTETPSGNHVYFEKANMDEESPAIDHVNSIHRTLQNIIDSRLLYRRYMPVVPDGHYVCFTIRDEGDDACVTWICDSYIDLR